MRQSRAALAQTQVNLQKTVIVSPIDGIVISRSVDVGQTVAASLQAPTLYTIAADLSQMQLKASIDESDLGNIKDGQVVTFHVDAYPNDVFHGKVRQVRLNPVIESNVVTYAAIISAPNAELKLKPGMTATITVEVARRDNVLRVPSAALRFKPTSSVLAALGQPQADLGRTSAGGAVVATAGKIATPSAQQTVWIYEADQPATGAGHRRRDRRVVHRDSRRQCSGRHDACDACCAGRSAGSKSADDSVIVQ